MVLLIEKSLVKLFCYKLVMENYPLKGRFMRLNDFLCRPNENSDYGYQHHAINNLPKLLSCADPGGFSRLLDSIARLITAATESHYH